MENMDSLLDQPAMSGKVLETLLPSVGHDTLWKALCLTYTEGVAGSSPVPPTHLGCIPKGQPPRHSRKALGFPSFALDTNSKNATLIEAPQRKRNHIPMFWNPIAGSELYL